MEPNEIGRKYDSIAESWNEETADSHYGMELVNRAIRYCIHRKKALDIGCGSGGRIIYALQEYGFEIMGIDVSVKMIELAVTKHPSVIFKVIDVQEWETSQKFDLIIAWDSIFHLPLASHKPVLDKIVQWLSPGGIFLYTLGEGYGTQEGPWTLGTIHYSSIGIEKNLSILAANGCQCRHLEFDQFPANHLAIIARKDS